MGLFSFFQGGAKYFDKKIDPKCDYCMYGKRTKDGNRVLCEKRGLVEQSYSCKAFIYSPLKRIPVKQLRFVGSIADDDLFIESKGDRAEKEAAEKKSDNKDNKNDKPAGSASNSSEQKTAETAKDVKQPVEPKAAEQKPAESKKAEQKPVDPKVGGSKAPEQKAPVSAAPAKTAPAQNAAPVNNAPPVRNTPPAAEKKDTKPSAEVPKNAKNIQSADKK